MYLFDYVFVLREMLLLFAMIWPTDILNEAVQPSLISFLLLRFLKANMSLTSGQLALGGKDKKRSLNHAAARNKRCFWNSLFLRIKRDFPLIRCYVERKWECMFVGVYAHLNVWIYVRPDNHNVVGSIATVISAETKIVFFRISKFNHLFWMQVALVLQ